MESSSSEQTAINRRPKSANPNRRAASYRVSESRNRQGSTEHSYQTQQSIDECPARPTTPEKTSVPPPSYEHIQKASALRVLHKTIQRERDVVHQSTNSNPTESDEIPEVHQQQQQLFRKATPPPRRLRPLGREYSGPF